MVLELAAALLSFDAYAAERGRSTRGAECMLVTGRDVFWLRHEQPLAHFAGEKVIVRGWLEKRSATIDVASIKLARNKSRQQA